MKKIIISLSELLLALVGAIVPATKVFAESVEKPAIWLQISPVAKRFQLDANAQIVDKITVDNIGSKKFKFRVYVSPYSISNEAYEVSFENETKRTQISRWVTFNQNINAKDDSEKEWKNEVTFELEPNGRQEIEFKISVPGDIPAGGQYATIFAESIPEENVSSTGIRTISRVGMLLYGNTSGETVDKAELKNFQMKSFLTSGKISAEVDISNGGNTDFSAQMNMEINKIIGGKVADDQTAITLNNYVAGTYGVPGTEKADRTTIELLETERLKDQFCFRTIDAILSLQFVRSERYGNIC
jgi:hypothetical protein